MMTFHLHVQILPQGTFCIVLFCCVSIFPLGLTLLFLIKNTDILELPLFFPRACSHSLNPNLCLSVGPAGLCFAEFVAHTLTMNTKCLQLGKFCIIISIALHNIIVFLIIVYSASNSETLYYATAFIYTIPSLLQCTGCFV